MPAAPTAHDVLVAARAALDAVAALERVALAYAPAHYRASVTHLCATAREGIAHIVNASGARPREGA